MDVTHKLLLHLGIWFLSSHGAHASEKSRDLWEIYSFWRVLQCDIYSRCFITWCRIQALFIHDDLRVKWNHWSTFFSANMKPHIVLVNLVWLQLTPHNLNDSIREITAPSLSPRYCAFLPKAFSQALNGRLSMWFCTQLVCVGGGGMKGWRDGGWGGGGSTAGVLSINTWLLRQQKQTPVSGWEECSGSVQMCVKVDIN